MKSNIYEHQSSIEIIKEFYLLRSSKNRSYSLRAFARDLQISPQVLSNMFHRRHKMSLSRAKMLVTRLGLSKEEADYFLTLVELESSRNKIQKDKALKKVVSLLNQMRFQELDEKKHSVLADITNVLCLQIMKVDHFDGRVSFISDRLKIPEAQIESRLKKLVRLGLVERQDSNYWPLKVDFKVQPKLSNQNVQRFHQQVIKKSLGSIKKQKFSERKLHSTIGAIDQKSYQKILQILEGAQKEVLSEMKNSEAKKVVYACSLQFFSMENKTLTSIENN